MNEQTGLKNNQLISELLTSGSSAVVGKNSKDVYIFSDRKNTDGVVYGSLTRSNYNSNELEKIVDTDIYELLPPDLTEEQSTVIKELFDAKAAEAELLTLQNEDLRNQLNNADAAISGLENTLENALIDLDQKDLLLAAAENQSKQSNEKVASTIKELQNAIQRATAESIERAKLAATNAALLEQLKSYKDQLQKANSAIDLANETITGARASQASVDAVVSGFSSQNGTLVEILTKLTKK